MIKQALTMPMIQWIGATFIAAVTLVTGGFTTFQTKSEATIQNLTIKEQLGEIKIEQKQMKSEQKEIKENQIRMEEKIDQLLRRS